MLEIIKNRTFTIKSPSGRRKITFSEPLEDLEVASFKIDNEKLLLLDNKSQVFCKLQYNKGVLSGQDIRGGSTELSPSSNDKAEFEAFFKVSREGAFVNLKKTLEKNKYTDVAIISETQFEGFDCYDPKNKKLFDLYSELFDKGYNLILNINCKTTPHFVPLLISLSEEKLSAKVGSVQLYSAKIGEPNEICLEEGDWKGFSLNRETWLKIKTKMNNRNFNFYRNLTLQFREKRLLRYSTKLSRDLHWTPQDSRRKKFIEV